MQGRTVWIVDGAYLLKAAPGHFDYLRLKSLLEGQSGGELYESYYLNSTSSQSTDAQSGFHNWLKTAPPRGPKMRVQLYELKTMHVHCPECGNHIDRAVQKGVDVGIATLTIKLATQGRYDRLILSAGDGDFEDALLYVKSELHKEIWIAGFEDSISADLQSYADRVLWLNAYWDEIRK